MPVLEFIALFIISACASFSVATLLILAFLKERN